MSVVVVHDKMDLISAGFIFLVFLPCVFSVTFDLERSLPLNQPGVVNFTIQGSANHNGFYYTKVKIGSPPRDYTLLIDTGSDPTWVSCEPCDGCPTLNRFGIPLSSYSPYGSSSSSRISCSEKFCKATKTTCSKSSECPYSFGYEDTSKTTGFYMEDILHYETIMNGSATTYASTSFIFGCSNYRSGGLASDASVDGILGLGRGSSSIISQLSSQGVIPEVFSHCLRRDNGGILVLGEISHPGITYTPLVPSASNYFLNLQSITIGGKVINFDLKVVASRGTVIDSGTTLAILSNKAYDPFVNFLIAVVSRSAQPLFIGSNLCFQVSDWNKVNDIFPEVSFNFEGGVSMVAKPKDYLRPLDSATPWCIGFQKGVHDYIILGDLILRDKIIIYDLANRQLGWTDYDCSQPVNVTSTIKGHVNKGHRNGSSSTIFTLLRPVISCIATLIVVISMVS